MLGDLLPDLAPHIRAGRRRSGAHDHLEALEVGRFGIRYTTVHVVPLSGGGLVFSHSWICELISAAVKWTSDAMPSSCARVSRAIFSVNDAAASALASGGGRAGLLSNIQRKTRLVTRLVSAA